MRLKIKNIGMISDADILLDGLTVIAGENDTGKSTVGKILFCLIKTVSRYQEDFSESKHHKIEDILNKIRFHIRRTAHITDEAELDKLNSLFSSDHLFWLDEESSFISQLQDYVLKLDIDEETLSKYYKLINQIETILIEPEDKNKYIQSALTKVFRAEFDSDILKHNTEFGKIELFENKLQLLDIIIENNNKITLSQNCQPLYFNDATFIETPLILNNHDLLIRATTGINATKLISRRLGLPYTTLHTKDLFDKLKEAHFSFLEEEEVGILNHEIMALINGELIYDRDDKDFKYIKNDSKIPIKNTATGIKSFGILQILAENEFLNENSFLILDEPEIHLHPKWQLKYAQLITLLIKNNVPVLIASHSPYMIEALQKYNDNKNVNFYLTKDENIEKVNDDNFQTLSAIFSKLSEPFEEFEKLEDDDF